jgi:hypothetical protein
MTEPEAQQWMNYRRTHLAEMADWTPGFDMLNVSVSHADAANGSPKLGDKIARNPANHDDKWLVAKAYFEANFEAPAAPSQTRQPPPEQCRDIPGWPEYWASLDKDSQDKLTAAGLEGARAWFAIGAVWGARHMADTRQPVEGPTNYSTNLAPVYIAEQIFFHVLMHGGEGNPFRSIANKWFIDLAAPKIRELLTAAPQTRQSAEETPMKSNTETPTDEELRLANTPEGKLLTQVTRELTGDSELEMCSTCRMLTPRMIMRVSQEAMRRWASLQAPSPNDWIPVSEKLPEPVKEVLIIVLRHVWSNSGKTIVPADSWVQLGSLRPDKVWIDDDSTIGTADEKRASKIHQTEWREVTHWMPKPELPPSAYPSSPSLKGEHAIKRRQKW